MEISMLLPLLTHFRSVQLCETPSTAAHQSPLSLGFSRQEYWSGLPFPSPGDQCGGSLKIELPYGPVIPLMAIYPEKDMVPKDTCTPMFTAALFIIVKTWKQPKCPLTEEWVKKMWYIYIMEYYLAMKKNEIRRFAATCMDLERVILSAVRQRINIIWHPYMWNLKRNDRNEVTYRTERDSQKMNLWLPGDRVS